MHSQRTTNVVGNNNNSNSYKSAVRLDKVEWVSWGLTGIPKTIIILATNQSCIYIYIYECI